MCTCKVFKRLWPFCLSLSRSRLSRNELNSDGQSNWFSMCVEWTKSQVDYAMKIKWNKKKNTRMKNRPSKSDDLRFRFSIFLYWRTSQHLVVFSIRSKSKREDLAHVLNYLRELCNTTSTEWHWWWKNCVMNERKYVMASWSKTNEMQKSGERNGMKTLPSDWRQISHNAIIVYDFDTVNSIFHRQVDAKISLLYHFIGRLFQWRFPSLSLCALKIHCATRKTLEFIRINNEISSKMITKFIPGTT